MSSPATSGHVTHAEATTSTSKVHVPCVMPLPIIREPSFKSELHIPMSKRSSPHPRPDEAHLEAGRSRSPTVVGGKSFVGRLGKRLSKDHIRLDKLDVRRSSESLNNLRSSNQDDTVSLKSWRDGVLSPFVVMSPVWFRKKYAERQDSHRRQMSCKDLGGADCEGWLWKKREGSGQQSKKWAIRWFELDRKKLRYFKHDDDPEPLGVINLPGLKVSPAPEVKNKKFAFKAHHSGTTFFFAAETQEDMVKWMNKMGLASLEDLDLGRQCTTAGFLRPDRDIDDDDASSSRSRSGSDADSLDSLSCGSRLSSRPNSQRSSIASSREDLVDLYGKLYRANIGIDGCNIKDRRTTAFFSSIGQTEEEQRRFQRLLTLRRSLQDKEEQLRIINELLDLNPIKSENIASFRQSHPQLIAELEKKTQPSDSVDLDEDAKSDPDATPEIRDGEIILSCKPSDLFAPFF